MSEAAGRTGPDEPAGQEPSAAPSAAVDPRPRGDVRGVVRGWQQALADVAGRNTLLWFDPAHAHADSLLDLTMAHPGGISKLVTGRPTAVGDLVREPAAAVAARRRATAIAEHCDQVLQQRGMLVGFAAMGLATWGVGTGRRPMAPVLLRPVRLRPTSHDVELQLGPEVEVNPVLVRALAEQAGIRLDEQALTASAAVAGGFDPTPAYGVLERACAGLTGFAVTSRLLVGTFPHSKLDLVADLADHTDALLAHPVVAALAGDEQATAALRRLPDPETVADRDPADEQHVLPLDAGQADVVAAVVVGASLAVTAPDGAGSTQTVAALGAALAARGKSVLVVSPRRRDVTDLLVRLDGVGLRDLVLDGVVAATDRRVTLQQVVDTFQAVVDRGEPGRPEDDVRPVARARDLLRGHVAALHDVRAPWGVSAHEAQAAVAELAQRADAPRSRVRLVGPALRGLTRERLDTLAERLTEAARAGAWGYDGDGAPIAVAVPPLVEPEVEPGADAEPEVESEVEATPEVEAEPAATDADAEAGDDGDDGNDGDDGAGEDEAGAEDDPATSAADAPAAPAAVDDEPAPDPWYGAHVLTDAEVTRAREIVTRLGGGGLDRATALLDVILEESALPRAATVDDWGHALTTMAGVRQTLEVFRPEVFDTPLDEHVAATASSADRRAEGSDLGTVARMRVRQQAKRLLRPGRPPADLHAELVAARSHRRAWQDLVGAGGRPEISPRLDEAVTAHDKLRRDLDWLGARLATTSAGGDLTAVPLADLGDRLAALAARTDRLVVLPQVVPVLEELRSGGLAELVDDLAARRVPPEQVTPELQLVWWTSVLRHVRADDPRYSGHDGEQLRAAASAYRAADRAREGATAAVVRAAVDRAVRAAVSADRAAAASLLAEVDGSGRPHSVAALLGRCAPLLLATKPIWALSPYAVAETLPPGAVFDVVVVESAGALTVPESVAAVSRGRQVVVVGDPEGAPPTSFTVTPETAARDDAPASRAVPAPESLLEALARLLPTRRLRWDHVRRDERLTGLVRGRAGLAELVSVPGASAVSPVRVERVDGAGVVTAGVESAIESTEAEASRVVELVADHLRDHPRERLGVVAVTRAHAERLRDVLAHELRELPRELADTLSRLGPDAVVVHDLASLGGRRCDALLLSVGYGKTPHGRVLHRFPDLAGPGGGRLLRAALASARRRVTVVSALGPADLDPTRLTEPGPAALRALLVDAERVAGLGWSADGRALDPLLRHLATRLRWEGLEVREGVGTGRRVDLAVVDPAAPDHPLAIGGDGPPYVALTGTRERDRLWEEHLVGAGWRVTRVWSTDLYRDPAREVARVVTAVRASSASTRRAPGASSPQGGSIDADKWR